eukprot:1936494-Amphidinium_carterae.1
MPTFSALRYGRVLSLFARLATSSCVLTYSVLALSSTSRGSWHSLCVHALRWLQNSTLSFRNVPPPTLDNLPIWAEVTKVLGAEFKFILKHAVQCSAVGTEDELRSELPCIAIEMSFVKTTPKEAGRNESMACLCPLWFNRCCRTHERSRSFVMSLRGLVCDLVIFAALRRRGFALGLRFLVRQFYSILVMYGSPVLACAMEGSDL